MVVWYQLRYSYLARGYLQMNLRTLGEWREICYPGTGSQDSGTPPTALGGTVEQIARLSAMDSMDGVAASPQGGARLSVVYARPVPRWLEPACRQTSPHCRTG